MKSFLDKNVANKVDYRSVKKKYILKNPSHKSSEKKLSSNKNVFLNAKS
jgi:hypothetical protein